VPATADRPAPAANDEDDPLHGAPDDLLEASMRPAVKAGIGFKVHVVVLILLAGAGVLAYGYQLIYGIGTTGLNDQVFWGLYTAALVTFIGFSYGGALVSAILRLTNVPWRGGVSRIAEATALATLLMGALFPIIHVGRPERLWEIIVRPQINSPIVWDTVAISTYLLATLVLFGLPLVADMGMLRDRADIGGWRRRLYGRLSFGWSGSDRQRASLERALTIVAILIVPLAIIVHTVLSYAFSLTSRPGWHSTIFGPYFVIGAIYSGVAVVILAAVSYRTAYGLHRWIDDRVIRNLGYILVALAVAYGYSTFTEVTTEGYVSETADASVLFAVVLERFAPLFWGFILLGLVVPVLLVALPRTRTPLGISVASTLVIVSMFVKRYLITVPAQTQPLIGGEVTSYTPSAVELLVVLGAAAGIPLTVMLLFRAFPVLSVFEITEIEREQAERREREVRAVSGPVGAGTTEHPA
jgi:molybdopterin-containing oxidoreductase family membrane subunit